MTTVPALAHPNLGRPSILLMALACGVIVANLYYAQTLIDVIGPEIGMSASVAGLITTLTQLGYGLGLFLIVPVADLFENRRIVLGSILVTVIGCLAIAASQGGLVEVRAAANAGEFVASVRNGVRSQSWPSQPDASEISHWTTCSVPRPSSRRTRRRVAPACSSTTTSRTRRALGRACAPAACSTSSGAADR